MASIQVRKTKISVIYWYVNDNGEQKQKWDTLETKAEAKRRKAFVEYYQKAFGRVLIPNEDAYLQKLEEEKKRLEEEANKEPEEEQVKKKEIDKSETTLQDFLSIFVKLYGVSKWSPTTYSSKKGTIKNYINPLIGDWKLNEVTTGKLTEYYTSLLSHPEVPRAHQKSSGRFVQPANVKKIHDIIHCALNQALRWGYLDSKMQNPAALTTLPTRKKVKRKVWSPDTFKEAISTADDTLLLLCMHLAFACSLRVGEISGLTWDVLYIDEESIANNNARVVVNKELARVSQQAIQDLNEKEIIKIFPTHKPNCTTRLVIKTPKNESSNRTVWLPRTLALMIAEYKKEQNELKEFLGSAYNDYNLVIALDNGNPVESRIIRKRLQALYETQNLDAIVFHSLRHLSTKYKLKLTEGDIKSVQGDTGHSEAEMVTDVYNEIVDEDRRFNAKKLDEKFYSSLDSTEEPKPAEVKPQENLNETDSLILEILKNLSPEKKAKLLQESLMAC